ncbi:unnamed protein product [Malassezia sympodialis ATCC 42132]|uniref:uncharacterized protein n=1 Tax=Malassezia sympodialis (strain ATCC 42132) TaxID=1230383 RepID=UPI0002C1CA04|nr:uncharacterized protein MSY001_2620 [Malassezia sympodialis ATCC 42132]CCU99914.1 unnamed protein product [Malassezia sympodialis ATCC 42132]|eukprot:XP_018741137.1 uncharacterized protein MSY001_2620 [Malassezia sympodialis ATCC 42132]
MSEDGLDDELIALVGEDKSSPPPRQLSPDRSKGRRAALIEDLSDSDEDEEEDASRALYPLEGIYKDADDREWYRRDEITRRQQQAQLAAMVRSQQAAAGKTRRTGAKPKMSEAQRAKRRRDHARRELEDLDDPFAEDESEEDVFAESDDDEPRRPATTKAAKLSELRRSRAERSRGVRARDDDASPPRRRRRAMDSDEYESESDYEPSYTPRRVRGESPILVASSHEPPSLEQLNAVRLGRDELERLLFMPNGKDVVRGCFVRCSWGMRERREGGKEPLYRVHQITDVQQREKYYDVSQDKAGRWMNSFLSFRWGGKDHSVDLRPISTQRISDSERQRWIAAAGPDPQFPSADAFEAKQRQVEAALSAPLTENDIKNMIQRKRELRTAAEAMGQGSTAAAVAAVQSNAPSRFDEHAMAQINERNRKQDRERIHEAERRAARAKQAAPPPAEPSAAQVSAALAAAPSGSAVVPNIDIDLGDF